MRCVVVCVVVIRCVVTVTDQPFQPPLADAAKLGHSDSQIIGGFGRVLAVEVTCTAVMTAPQLAV
jgi:hypothetical protein